MHKSWRFLFTFIFLQMTVDGFFIYFFFTFPLMHFVKDLVLILTFFFFAIQEPFRDWINQLGNDLGLAPVFCMLALLLVGLLGIFNPYAPGLTRGLLGLKLMFLPWLIIPLAYAYFDSFDVVQDFFKKLVLLSIPVNILGLLQFAKGPTFMVSTFGPGFVKNTQMAMLEAGSNYTGESFVRIFGTFSATSLYSQFLVFIQIVCFAILLSGSRPRWLWVAIIVQNFFCMLGTGSRGSLLGLVVTFLVFSKLLKSARSMVVGFFLFAVILFVSFATLGPRVQTRFRQAVDVKNIQQRTIHTSHKMFFQILEKYPLGKGIGSASQASRHLGKFEGKFELVENYLSKLQIEVGIVGVILFYVLMLVLTIRWQSWAAEFNEQNSLYLYFIALSAYFMGCLIAGVFPDTPPASIFFWACVGILPRLASIEQTQRKAPESSALES